MCSKNNTNKKGRELPFHLSAEQTAMAVQEEEGCVGWHKVNPCADLPHTPAQGIAAPNSKNLLTAQKENISYTLISPPYSYLHTDRNLSGCHL